jgi:uncharacterized repeat protein (TIGR03803 family)
MKERKQRLGWTFEMCPRIKTLALALAVVLAFSLAQVAPAQTFSLRYQFKSGSDGSYPFASLILDSKGNLYGATYGDGAFAQGTVFKVTPAGKETVLHSFTGTGGDGAYPYAPLLRDSSGNLYGTTRFGGAGAGSGCGTVFKVAPDGKETVLYKFTGTGGDGCDPQQGVVRDPKGNLYGTTSAGGGNGGTVFKVDPSGVETVLHTFHRTDGVHPSGGSLLRDSAGNLFGTALSGGADFGTVFKLDTSGTETVLCNFNNTNGASPYGSLVRDKAGNLYGVTNFGGAAGWGVVFKCDTSGNLTVLYSFSGTGGDGAVPGGGLVQDNAGNFYGTTNSGGTDYFGTVFKLDTTGKETILHSFSGTDGMLPQFGLVRDSKGNLYGDTYQGGAHGGGVVFKLKP